jgi:hypothetical protein
VQYLDGSAITNKKDKWEIQPDVEDHNTSNLLATFMMATCMAMIVSVSYIWVFSCWSFYISITLCLHNTRHLFRTIQPQIFNHHLAHITIIYPSNEYNSNMDRMYLATKVSLNINHNIINTRLVNLEECQLPHYDRIEAELDAGGDVGFVHHYVQIAVALDVGRDAF